VFLLWYHGFCKHNRAI